MREKSPDIYIDELTGVRNRRFLEHVKVELLPSMQDKEGVFSIIVTDLDHFKEINDTYGHLKGDEAIRFFGNFLKTNLRNTDIVVRYGGDEFIVIQPGISKKEAFIVWDRVLERLKNTEFDGLKLSASAGVATYPEDGKVFEELFKKADDRLYYAKRAGRGRVSTEDAHKKVYIPCVKHVDRIDDKDALKASIKSGVVAVIKGEAGIGKTRLIKEVLSSIKGFDVLFSDCLALERKIAYYVVRELVKYRIRREKENLIKAMPDALKIEIAKIIPGLLDDSEVIGDVMIDRYRLYEAFRYVINYGNRPKVVVIDNIQWIDEDSIEAIKYMLRMDRGEKIRFIFSVREEEESEVSEKFLRDISRERQVNVIELKPMKNSYLREMVRVMINDAHHELEKYVANASSGNPFYAEELLSALYHEGYLRIKGNVWEFKEPDRNILPRSIEDVVKRKISMLSEEGRELLKVLSVAVRGYVDLLVKITGYNESHVFGLIEEALRLGLVRENDTGEFIEFKSELIRNVVYSSLSRLKRRVLHRKVAEWIESNIPDGMEEDLAYHYYVQQNAEKVIEYGEKAGDKLRSIYAPREAMRYYKWALEKLEGKNDREHLRKKAQILLKVAEVSGHVGDYLYSEDCYKRVIEISDREGFYDLLTTAYNGLGWTQQILGKIEEARRNAEHALELARKHGYQMEEIGAYNTLGSTYRDTKDRSKTFEMYEKALEITRKANRVANEAIILNNMAIYLHEQDKYEEALRYYEMAETLCRENNLLSHSSMILYNMALVYIDKKLDEKAESLLKSAIDLARKIGYRRIEASALWAYGYHMFMNGKFRKALEFLENALSMFHGINDVRMTGVTYSTIGDTERALGFYRKALNSHSKSLTLFEQMGGGVNLVVEQIAIGKILSVLGQFNESESYFSKALNIAKDLDVAKHTIQALIGYSELFYEQENYEEAYRYLELAKKEAREKGVDSERFDILVMEYDILAAGEMNDRLYDIVKRMGESLNMPVNLEKQVILSLYECDVSLRTGKIDTCQQKLKEVEENVNKYPHAALLAELMHLKWKYSVLTRADDEEKRFYALLKILENLGFNPRIERIKKERMQIK